MAFGVNDKCFSVIFLGLRCTGSVDADDVGLVFDGTGVKKIDPVVFAGVGPVGDDDEDFCSLESGVAEDFGETQIVTNKGGDGEVVQLESDDFVSRLVILVFMVIGEGVDF